LCNPADFAKKKADLEKQLIALAMEQPSAKKEQAELRIGQINLTAEQKNFLTQIIEGTTESQFAAKKRLMPERQLAPRLFLNSLSLQNHIAMLLNLCEQDGSTLLHWEVRENIAPFVSGLAMRVLTALTSEIPIQDDTNILCDLSRVVQILMMMKRLQSLEKKSHSTRMRLFANGIANAASKGQFARGCKLPDVWPQYIVEILRSGTIRDNECLDVALNIYSSVEDIVKEFSPAVSLYSPLLALLGEKVKLFIYFSLLAPKKSSASGTMLEYVLGDGRANGAFIEKLDHARNYLKQILAPEDKQQFMQESFSKYITSIEAILQEKTSKRSAFLKAKNQLEAVTAHIYNSEERILKTKFLLEHVALRLQWTQEVVKVKQQLTDGEMTSNGVRGASSRRRRGRNAQEGFERNLREVGRRRHRGRR